MIAHWHLSFFRSMRMKAQREAAWGFYRYTLSQIVDTAVKTKNFTSNFRSGKHKREQSLLRATPAGPFHVQLHLRPSAGER